MNNTKTTKITNKVLLLLFSPLYIYIDKKNRA